MSDDTKILSESMKLRNTDTSVLKRMPAGNSSSESSAARKTIKLKPLAPRSGSNGQDTNTTSTITATFTMPDIKPLGSSSSEAVPAPSAMLNDKQQIADQETQVPQFMSTATAPVAHIAQPRVAPVVSASSIGTSSPSNTIKLKNALGAVATASKITPPAEGMNITATAAVPKIPIQKPAATGITGTVSMPRINMHPKPAPPPPTPSAVPEQTNTGSIPKYAATPTGSIPKIKLNETKRPPSYVTTATASVPKVNKQDAPAAPVGRIASIDEAKMQSGIAASKPAIKLRPSGNVSGPVPVAAPSAPTIKLAHKTDSTVSPMPPASEVPNATEKLPQTPGSMETVTLGPDSNSEVPAASDKTVDLPAAKPLSKDDVTVTTRIPRKVGFKKPSLPGQSAASKPPEAPADQPSSPAWSSGPASTAGLRMQDDIANKKTNAAIEESAQTIELNNTTNEADEIERKNREALAMAAEAAAKAKATREEPNLFFTISSIAALLFVCFTTYILVCQYLNTWKETKLPAIVFQQINDMTGKK